MQSREQRQAAGQSKPVPATRRASEATISQGFSPMVRGHHSEAHPTSARKNTEKETI